MKRALFAVPLFIACANAQQIRVIAFGAHPDDCDLGAAGTAAKFARMGHKVKFVAVTNGQVRAVKVRGSLTIPVYRDEMRVSSISLPSFGAH